MDYTIMLLRLGAAMLVGLFIGFEREYTGRPAGMRTHFLVAIGAAVVTVAGEHVAAHFGSDPMRLAAQVISGIGFLGAGTIIKEGINIRGLTTAASLWVTACLGIVAGAGLYALAAAGLAGTLLAFTLMERVEGKMNARRGTGYANITVSADGNVLRAVEEVLAQFRVELKGLSVEQDGGETAIDMRVKLPEKGRLTALVGRLSETEGVRCVSTMKSEQ